MSGPTVFISYSHRDEAWKDRLVIHLRALQLDDQLVEWDDRRIQAGDDWFKEIQDAMERASIVVLLVSTDFLASEFIRHEEVPPLLERRKKSGLRVIPVFVSPSNWQEIPWLSAIQGRPKDGRPLSDGNANQAETDLAAIAKEIRLLVSGVVQRSEPKGGWVSPPPNAIFRSKLPSIGAALFGRELELDLLDGAWADPDTNIISLVAFGGVGKSAMVNHWLDALDRDRYRGAQRVYGWSFYSQGTRETEASADVFIDAALRWFGETDTTGLTSPWLKGERLAQLVKQERTLLVLDGLEPMQYGPGTTVGRLKDEALKALVRGLDDANPGLCVITTRLPVADIEHHQHFTAPVMDLERLSDTAGVDLLRSLGITIGSQEDLEQASREFGGHALALTLLGQYLTIVYGGDIRQRDKVPPLAHQPNQGGHARRVMESYEEWFEGKPELSILRIMGLFDRPVEDGARLAVVAEPTIDGLTAELVDLSHEDWQFALASLRQARLLARVDPQAPDALDTHPLVRG